MPNILRNGVIAGIAGYGLLLVGWGVVPHDRAFPAVYPLDEIKRVGHTFITTEALDCYGSSVNAATAIAARNKLDDIAARNIWITQMGWRGITLDANQRITVVQSGDYPYVKVRVDGGVYNGEKCWVYAHDAVLVMR